MAWCVFLFSQRCVSIFTKWLLKNNCPEVRTCHLSRSGFPLSLALVASIHESQKRGNSLWSSFLLPIFSNAHYLGWGPWGHLPSSHFSLAWPLPLSFLFVSSSSSPSSYDIGYHFGCSASSRIYSFSPMMASHSQQSSCISLLNAGIFRCESPHTAKCSL